MSDRSADIHAIRDVVTLYCRGIDRLDFDLVRQAYHPDGIDHHTGFDGTVDEYVAWVRKSLEYLAGTMHLIGNHHVDFAGDDVAISETYLMATHWGKPGTDQRANFTTGARYVDLMERRRGRWAIAERWAVREWTRPDVFAAPEQPGPRGRRDADDPLFVLLKRFDL
ncbi:nuclear transport factor 2 family protein [Mycobacterium sp. EPa45]|uniref:nuclear transport factor 2 family protein n=1 Tax=Mycobacterium sp. EPa45 TaxID=1545728 RepID=UPI00064201AD|nr:nuclear transport factor 2 family protein [Mycobacterium sp. EPa45]AKK29765.1 gamma-BHC dehydrochlorinase [Mycobacterium sp. EPa45]